MISIGKCEARVVVYSSLLSCSHITSTTIQSCNSQLTIVAWTRKKRNLQRALLAYQYPCKSIYPTRNLMERCRELSNRSVIQQPWRRNWRREVAWRMPIQSHLAPWSPSCPYQIQNASSLELLTVLDSLPCKNGRAVIPKQLWSALAENSSLNSSNSVTWS